MVDALATKYLSDVESHQAKEQNWGKNLFQYRESKLFMNIYTRVLAAQLSSNKGHEKKIYVNAICPGAMKTGLLQSFVSKVGAAKAEELSASVRWTPVEDAGVACASLALLPPEKYPQGKFFAKQLEERPW